LILIHLLMRPADPPKNESVLSIELESSLELPALLFVFFWISLVILSAILSISFEPS